MIKTRRKKQGGEKKKIEEMAKKTVKREKTNVIINEKA